MAASLDFFINPQVKTTSMSKIQQITNKSKLTFKKLEATGKRTFSSISKKVKEARNNQEHYNKSLGGMKGALKGVLGMATAYMGVSQIISGVNLASEVDETNNKMEAVFQNMTGSVRGTMKDMSKELGIGQVTLGKDFANIGAIFKGLGFEGEGLTKNTENLLKAAYDTASFHNMDFQQSIGAIRGAMLGESEALKGATGIIVQDSNMAEYAGTLGMVWKDLNVASKAQLRFNYIMRQLKKQGAAGDLAKTKDSFENVKKTIGELTTDIKAGFFAALKNNMLPGLISVRDFLTQNKDAIIGFGQSLSNLSNGIASVFNTLKPALTDVWNVSKQIFGGISAFYKENEESFRAVFEGIVSFISITLQAVAKILKLVSPVIKAIAGPIVKILGILGKGVSGGQAMVNKENGPKQVSYGGSSYVPGMGNGPKQVSYGGSSYVPGMGSTVNNFNTQNSTQNSAPNVSFNFNNSVDSKEFERVMNKKVKEGMTEYNRQQLAAIGGA
jgi:hypothetical protein